MRDLKRLTPAQREQATEMMYKAEEAATQVAEEEQRREQLLEQGQGAAKPRIRVSQVIHPRVTISIGLRTTAFAQEL